jgi:Flp pilus assembly protein CpaB
VLNRGVVAPVMKNEPLAESKLAPIEAGVTAADHSDRHARDLGEVNEVIGVAGFTVPGRAWISWRWFATTPTRCRESSSPMCSC